jgi:hypothetical protein
MATPFSRQEAAGLTLDSYRYEASPFGHGGDATFVWSDGSDNNVRVASEDALLRMVETIQRRAALRIRS